MWLKYESEHLQFPLPAQLVKEHQQLTEKYVAAIKVLFINNNLDSAAYKDFLVRLEIVERFLAIQALVQRLAGRGALRLAPGGAHPRGADRLDQAGAGTGRANRAGDGLRAGWQDAGAHDSFCVGLHR